MEFGIYCNNTSEHNLAVAETLVKILKGRSHTFLACEELAKTLSVQPLDRFSSQHTLEVEMDALITIGGDGTILSAISLVTAKNIPILGINTGRLGFLSSITIAEIELMLDELEEGKAKMEHRGMLDIQSNGVLDEDMTSALNEVSVLKKDSSSMIAIHASMDGEFLNTYWADGLIISTATGSTAYSLSCGGPIVAPGSGNLIITPIAPHNLNVRPFVVPDTSTISLRFETRSGDLLVALDTKSKIVSDQIEIQIKKAKQEIRLLRTSQYSYLETLRNKMNWGLDKRN